MSSLNSHAISLGFVFRWAAAALLMALLLVTAELSSQADELLDQTNAKNSPNGWEDRCCLEQGTRCCSLSEEGICLIRTVFNCSGDSTDYRAELILTAIYPGACVQALSGDNCCEEYTWLCCGKTRSYELRDASGNCIGTAGCYYWYWVTPGCFTDTGVECKPYNP